MIAKMRLYNSKLCDYNNLFDWSGPLEFCLSFITWNLLSATIIVDILPHQEIYFLSFAYPISECYQFERQHWVWWLLVNCALYILYIIDKIQAMPRQWPMSSVEISGLFFPSFHLWDDILYCKLKWVRNFEN